jgi:hypothetical protein
MACRDVTAIHARAWCVSNILNRQSSPPPKRLYCIFSSLVRMSWTGHVARMGEKRNACRILVGKPEGRRPLGRPRRK